MSRSTLRWLPPQSKSATPTGCLRLTVSDTGVGIEPGRVEATDGLGLVSIRERTRLVGGSLEIISKPNQGTTVTVRIPD